MTLLTIRSRNSSICSRSVISSNTSGSFGSGSRGREGSLIGTLTGSRDGRTFSDDGLRIRAIRGISAVRAGADRVHPSRPGVHEGSGLRDARDIVSMPATGDDTANARGTAVQRTVPAEVVPALLA